MDRKITYDFIDIEIPDFDPEFFDLWLLALVEHYKAEIISLGYVFCSDERLKEMNKEHLSHDYYTDIITFNYNDNISLNAEMFISYERVVDNAKNFGNGNVKDELHRVMAHGLLHCVGFNDKTEAEEKEMRVQEDLCLGMRESFT